MQPPFCTPALTHVTLAQPWNMGLANGTRRRLVSCSMKGMGIASSMSEQLEDVV